MQESSQRHGAGGPPNWEAGVNLDGLRRPKHVGVCINFGVHVWYQILSGIERQLGEELGIKVDAVDAAMDPQVQAEQVKQFVTDGVDVLVFSPADAATAATILQPALAAGIPIIVESIWLDLPDVVTHVMINDFEGGRKVGWAAAGLLQDTPGAPARILDVTVPWLDEGVRRSDGFLAGVRDVFPQAERIQVDGRAEIDTSARLAEDVLRGDPGFNLVFGVDDESAIGARQAYEQLQLPMEDVVVASFGLSGAHAYELLTDGSFQTVCAMFPEYAAHMIMHAAMYAYNRRPLPRHLVVPTAALTSETLAHYYTRTPAGVQLNYDAVKQISTQGEERA